MLYNRNKNRSLGSYFIFIISNFRFWVRAVRVFKNYSLLSTLYSLLTTNY